MENNRVEREKEWHNETFETDVRTSIDKYYSIHIHINNDLFDSILLALNPNFTKLLDYGCGSGYYLTGIANNIKEGVGIDISEALIDNARRIANDKNLNNIKFYVMDSMSTNFKDNEFDVIHGQSILHHLDLIKSLGEIKRILTIGGRAYFLEPLSTNPIIKLYRKLTPKARTIDEQPFRRKDIKIIQQIFPNMEIKYYCFLSLLAVPFRNTKYFTKILAIFNSIDKVLLNNKSPLKWMAWSCILILKK